MATQETLFTGKRPLSTTERVTSSPAEKKSSRIDYIDGIRALAALAVVFLHAFQMRGYGGVEPLLNMPPDLLLSNSPLGNVLALMYDVGGNLGLYAVKIFIVISGFTLMLGAAKSLDGKPKGGLRGYFKRRVTRIWPPYYAALLISLAIIFLVPGMNTEFGGYHDQFIPVTTQGLVSHLLFIQNLSPEWASQINTPLWTIAVEEQIYLIFPFLLLPLWRRFPSVIMIPIAAIVPILVSLVVPYRTFLEIRPWFLVLFAIGALAASISFSKRPQDMQWRQRLPWVPLAAVFVVFWAGIKYMLPRVPGLVMPDGFITDPFSDPFLAAAVGCMLVHWTKVWERGIPRISVLAVLNSRLLVKLGVFSYSIYLMHAPLQAILTQIMRGLGINSDLFYVLILVPGIPIVVGLAYVFHIIFERPFMPQVSPKPEAIPAKPAAVSGD